MFELLPQYACPSTDPVFVSGGNVFFGDGKQYSLALRLFMFLSSEFERWSVKSSRGSLIKIIASWFKPLLHSGLSK